MRKNPGSPSPSYRLLLLEDDPNDARLVQAALENHGPRQFVITRVERLSTAIDRLADEQFDVMLCDLGLPDSGGLEAVQTIRERGPTNLPIVVLTGLDDGALGREAIQYGAQDYLVKGSADGPMLARAIGYAIERKRLETVLREANQTLARRVDERTAELEKAIATLRSSEERFRRLFEDAPTGVAIVDLGDRSYVRANASYCAMFGYEEEDLKRLTFADLTHPDDRVEVEKVFNLARKRRLARYRIEKRYLNRSGKVVWGSLFVSVVCDDRGTPLYSLAMVEDISERKRLEQAMQALPQQIIAAQEEERRQLSSALHHDVGSLAVGMSAHLDAIEVNLRTGKVAEGLKSVGRARSLFESTVTGLKELAIQLRPVELDILGLSAALRQQFARLTRTGKTRIEFADSLGGAALSERAATALFRIAQEGSTNAVAHGKAKRVWVRLDSSRGKIRMTVKDNGRGFDPSAIAPREKPCMGLRVMREMALAAGGEFRVDSSPGKGCRLSVTIAGAFPVPRVARVRTRVANNAAHPPRKAAVR